MRRKQEPLGLTQTILLALLVAFAGTTFYFALNYLALLKGWSLVFMKMSLPRATVWSRLSGKSCGRAGIEPLMLTVAEP